MIWWLIKQCHRVKGRVNWHGKAKTDERYGKGRLLERTVSLTTKKRVRQHDERGGQSRAEVMVGKKCYAWLQRLAG